MPMNTNESVHHLGLLLQTTIVHGLCSSGETAIESWPTSMFDNLGFHRAGRRLRKTASSKSMDPPPFEPAALVCAANA